MATSRIHLIGIHKFRAVVYDIRYSGVIFPVVAASLIAVTHD